MGQGCLPKKINKTSQLRFFCAGDTPFRHLDFRAATFVSETCNKRNPPARAHPYPCSWLTTSARSSTENTTYQSGAVAYRLTGVGRQGGASRPQRSPVHNKKTKKIKKRGCVSCVLPPTTCKATFTSWHAMPCG